MLQLNRALRNAVLLGQGAGVAVVAFDPASVGGLAFDLDPGRGVYQDGGGTTPATADTDPVGRAVDQSGAGNTVTQGTAGSRPLLKLNVFGTRPSLLFDGSDDYLSATAFASLTGAMALYAVLKPVDTTATHWALAAASDGADTSFILASLGTNNQPGWWQDGGGPTQSYSALSAGTKYLLSARRSGTSGSWTITLRKNGAADASGTTAGNAAGNGGFAVGRLGAFNGYYLNGHVGRVLIYSQAVSDADNATIEAGLNGLYGVY